MNLYVRCIGVSWFLRALSVEKVQIELKKSYHYRIISITVLRRLHQQQQQQQHAIKLEFHGTETDTDTDFRDAPVV